MNATDICNEEREPAKAWKSLGDCDHTMVRVELSSHTGATLVADFEIVHVDDDVRHIGFPQGWRYLVRTLGHDPSDTAVEGWLETLAKMAFRRAGA